MTDNFSLELLQHLSGAVNARDAYVRLLDRCREASRADGAAVLRNHLHRAGHELVLTMGLSVKPDFVFATTITEETVTGPEVSREESSLIFQDTQCAANLTLRGRDGNPVAIVHLEWADPASMALQTLKDMKDAFNFAAPLVQHLQRYDSRISIVSSSGDIRPDEVDLELDIPEPKLLFRRLFNLLSGKINIEGGAFVLKENGDLVAEETAHFGKIQPLPRNLTRQKHRAIYESVEDTKPVIQGNRAVLPIRFMSRGLGAAVLVGGKRPPTQDDLNRAQDILDQASLFVEKARLYRITKTINPHNPLLFVGVPRDVLELCESYADAEAPILVQGNTGTGKESVARFIHMIGPRKHQPFLPFNCAELVENLAESQLFGHVKGAFTGAESETTGIFEQATGGTLFLDEIHVLTPPLQAKFLRAIETGEVRPVGSSGPPKKIDVRIVVATNQDLSKLVSEGKFLHDLYMRLDVLQVAIPALKDNRHTILKIASALLAEIAERNRKKVTGFTPRAKQALFLYDYPGNIRELKNILEKSVVTTKAPIIDADVLPKKLVNAKGGDKEELAVELFEPDYESYKSASEKRYLLRLLERSSGNVAEAARMSGLHRTHIYNLMKKHELTAQQFKA